MICSENFFELVDDFFKRFNIKGSIHVGFNKSFKRKSVDFFYSLCDYTKFTCCERRKGNFLVTKFFCRFENINGVVRDSFKITDKAEKPCRFGTFVIE